MKNPNNSSKQNAKPSYDVWKGSYRIAISLAAAAIGLSCIATDASARGGGGHSGGAGGGHMGGMAMGGHNNHYNNHNRIKPEAVGVSVAAGARGVGTMQGAPYYAASSQYDRPVCGYYPYPPCRRRH